MVARTPHHSQPLTEAFFTTFMRSFQEGLREEFATKTEFQELTASIAKLTGSIDQYIVTTQTWHQEQVILRTKVDRLVATLVKHGVIKEDELAP